MRRIAIAVATLGLLLAAAPAASAAVCTRDEAVVTLETPSHVNAGKLFEFKIANPALEGEVSDVTLTVGDRTGGVELPASTSVWIRPRAPQQPGRLAVDLTWRQTGDPEDDESPVTCEGTLSTTVTVVKASLKIGDPGSPRVDGSWSIVVTPINYGSGFVRAALRTTSRCDIGACSFAFGPPGAGTVALALGGDGVTYARQAPQSAQPRYACFGARGEVVVRNAFFERITWRLKVIGERRTASGALQARRIQGERTRILTATGEARRHGCRDEKLRDRIVMTRR